MDVKDLLCVCAFFFRCVCVYACRWNRTKQNVTQEFRDSLGQTRITRTTSCCSSKRKETKLQPRTVAFSISHPPPPVSGKMLGGTAGNWLCLTTLLLRNNCILLLLRRINIRIFYKIFTKVKTKFKLSSSNEKGFGKFIIINFRTRRVILFSRSMQN